MKNTFIILCLIFTKSLIAQSNNGISVAVLYSGISEFNIETGYSKQIIKNLEFNLSVGSNFNYSIVLRAGINYVFFKNKWISPTIGSNYSYEKIWREESYLNILSTRLEFPIGFRINLNEDHHILLDAIPSMYMHSHNLGDNMTFINAIKLGYYLSF